MWLAIHVGGKRIDGLVTSLDRPPWVRTPATGILALHLLA